MSEQRSIVTPSPGRGESGRSTVSPSNHPARSVRQTSSTASTLCARKTGSTAARTRSRSRPVSFSCATRFMEPQPPSAKRGRDRGRRCAPAPEGTPAKKKRTLEGGPYGSTRVVERLFSRGIEVRQVARASPSKAPLWRYRSPRAATAAAFSRGRAHPPPDLRGAHVLLLFSRFHILSANAHERSNSA